MNERLDPEAHESINSALSRLGFLASGKAGYEKAFGISLAKRSPKEIGPMNLVAREAGDAAAEINVEEGAAAPEASLREQADLWFKQISQSGEEDSMGTPIQNLTAGMVSSVLLTLSPTEADAAKQYQVGVCQVQQRDSPENLYPISTASSYIYNYQRNNPAFKSIDLKAFRHEAKASLVNRPKLGNIEVAPGQWGDRWDYVPTKFNKDGTYVGRDHFIVKVDYKGVAVFIHYYIEVIGNDPPSYIDVDQERKDHFCKTGTWKISRASDASGADVSEQILSAQLTALISSAGDAAKGWQDLSGAAVATTIGTGNFARITFDTTAAGHGWYLDPTPLDNTDDFLPTADKTIWRAKAGTPADGKMDLLSVLLHEYGHVLGLDHDADGANFMAATLQPGERRLPTDAELAWMAQRVAELKAEQEASDTAASSEGSDQAPAQPRQPQPAYPAWGTLANATRLARRSPSGAAGPDPAAADTAARTQFATAVNAGLTNGGFVQSGLPSGAGWMTQGDVRFTPEGAVLGEAGARQARLLQGFALGENDRFLSFTIAGTGLAANAAGPNDAFEVALLDANSGLPIGSAAGTVALTGSDALLNRQASTATGSGQGAERLGFGVKSFIQSFPTQRSGTQSY